MSWEEQSGTQAMPPVPRHRLRDTPPPAPQPVHVDEPPGAVAPGIDPTGEPVVIAHAVTVILGALVTAGWVAIPNATIDTIGTVVALVLSTVGAVLARARVAPLNGGLWQAITSYVADLVASEVARHPVSTRR